MGQLFNIKCQKCTYETNLRLGNGRSYNRLESVIGLFDKDLQDKIRALLDEGTAAWEVHKELGICKKCGRISAIAVFKAVDPKGDETIYHSGCICGSDDIEFYDIDKLVDGNEYIVCPDCGDKLIVAATGYWD